MKQKIKLTIAGTREVERKSMVALLNNDSGLEVIDDAANGKELIELLKHQTPDIVMMDKDMPIMDAVATMEVMHRRFPDVKVMVMAEDPNAEMQADFMARGANCFLGKSCMITTLFTAISKVYTDGYYFDESMSKALLETVMKEKQRSLTLGVARFNERETDILKRICDGNTNKQIAFNLHLSASTIDFYRTRIYNKTKCNNVIGLVKFALRNGIISLM